MKENKTVLKHGAMLATVDQNEKWVKAKARELDREKEMDLAWELCRIMAHFQQVYDFAGISSNNIFWETTDTPVRMIYIPLGKSYVTVLNPKYKKLAGRSVNSTERLRFDSQFFLCCETEDLCSRHRVQHGWRTY